jgi:hypothetical protein
MRSLVGAGRSSQRFALLIVIWSFVWALGACSGERLDVGDVGDDAGDAGDDGGGPLECTTADAEVASELDRLWSDPNACTEDADCTIVAVAIDCDEQTHVSTCGEAVHAASQAELELALDAVHETVCPRLPTGCRNSASCAPVAAACEEKRCVLTPVAP